MGDSQARTAAAVMRTILIVGERLVVESKSECYINKFFKERATPGRIEMIE